LIQLVPDPPTASAGLVGAQIAQNRTGRTSTAAHAEEVCSELELTKRSSARLRRRRFTRSAATSASSVMSAPERRPIRSSSAPVSANASLLSFGTVPFARDCWRYAKTTTISSGDRHRSGPGELAAGR
jgi:hypothetical protein